MPNQYKNKVIYNNQTLIDLTSDTVTAADVAQGKTFHLASGEPATGTASGVETLNIYAESTSDQTFYTDADDMQVKQASLVGPAYVIDAAAPIGTIVFSANELANITGLKRVSSATNYVYEVAKPTLAGTTWYFNETLETSVYDKTFYLEFTTYQVSDGVRIYMVISRKTYRLTFYDSLGVGVPVYTRKTTTGVGGWNDERNRTVVVTGGDDAMNAELIAWFQNNAMQIA